MSKEKIVQPAPVKKRRKISKDNHNSLVYGLGFLGAAIYYITTAGSFWTGLLGVLKAILWPAFLVYELMKYLGM